ncbi:MAG: hypothetical protein FJW94_09270 [Actinobacteria bacterium]|nr:hypothetical protein [Actinomycetota bacterium]
MLQLSAAPAEIVEHSAARRDRFLDVVKAVAVVRVVLWHTLSWPWLSWIPAMPAMFFANGALLDRSVGKAGWWQTVRSRFRRLLLPYWAYAAASVMVMVAAGWRPGLGDLLPWVFPVVDPVGSVWGSQLWIPLWYVRAYLWFVVLAAPMRIAVRRWPVASAATVVLAVVSLGRWQAAGIEIPMAVGDLLTYSPFVVAGMLYQQRGVPQRRWCLAAAGAAAAGAVVFIRLPPGWDGVVNRSWTLTAAVGVVGLGLALAYRSRLASVGGGWGRIVDLIGERALTIYLWQGFGLLAAAHLVRSSDLPSAFADVVALVVVGVTVGVAVFVFGPLEDRAGGRRSSLPVPPRATVALGAVIVLALVGASVAFTAPTGANSDVATSRSESGLPLSGRAALDRAELVEESLVTGADDEVAIPESAQVASDPAKVGASGKGEPGKSDEVGDLSVPERLAVVTERWLDTHAEDLAEIGFSSLSAAVVVEGAGAWSIEWNRSGAGVLVSPAAAGGSAPGTGRVFPWWSLTKAATATWLMRSVEAGLVRLDDPLSRWVPESPRSADMTLEQLARHTAGLPRDAGLPFIVSTPADDVGSWFDDGQLLFEPGTGFNYSRTGYHLLALALERAEGRAWTDAMSDLAAQSGAVVRFDDEGSQLREPTDPDRRGYRGGLWASGGLRSTPVDAAQFFHWVGHGGLRSSSVDAITAFSTDADRWFYGLGVTPRCPCRVEGDRLQAAAFGADGPGGSMASRLDGVATVVLAPDSWFEGDAPRREFFDLELQLLAAAA